MAFGSMNILVYLVLVVTTLLSFPSCEKAPEAGRSPALEPALPTQAANPDDSSKSAQPAAPATPPPPKPEVKLEPVTISGRTFKLEPALDDQTRFRGLSGRTEIAADGGMLFVFRKADELAFVMRDCPIPIDIIYLNGAGQVVSFHKMTPDEPRKPEELKNTAPFLGAPEWAWTNPAYEARLKKYPSKFAAQFVIELKGGTLDDLKLKAADKVDLDVARLKKVAK